MQIIMYGTAGAAGARQLWEKEESIRASLPACIGEGLRRACGSYPAEVTNDEQTLAIADGGVYAALWRLGEQYGLGLCVYGERIPILQETIEICEVADKNPYRLEGDGFLCVCSEMPPAGGQCIGYLTRSKERIVIGREGIRYLTKPERNY